MKRKRGLLLLAGLLAALALTLAACGGDDDDDTGDGNGAGPTATATQAGDTNGDNGDNSSDGDGGDGNGGDNGDSASALARLRQTAQQLDQSRFRAVYEMSGSGQGAPFTGTFTLASDPPRQSMAMEGLTGADAGTFIFITDGEKNIVCFEEAGQGQCLSTAADSQALPIELPFVADAPELIDEFTSADGVSVKKAGDRTIAGISAECYAIESPEGNADVCIGKEDGELLYMHFEDDLGSFTMEVKEFGQPTDEDFEPPYDVIEF
ncbi:MAG: hypothetical protein Kow0010_04050 [Dehalococcoidia bacterium]